MARVTLHLDVDVEAWSQEFGEAAPDHGVLADWLVDLVSSSRGGTLGGVTLTWIESQG